MFQKYKCYVILFTEPPQYRQQSRRKSVFVEGYNPENADGTKNTIYPKSDEQRSQLHEAVKNVLLFRELDSDQVSSVKW